MTSLPIRRMVLYKHGVGFFERFGRLVDSDRAELTFKPDEMNDVLKSLAAFPQGSAQVVTISYENLEEKEAAIANAAIQLGDSSTLLDLLKALRGRAVRLHLVDHNDSTSEIQGVRTTGGEFALTGTLIGIDAPEVNPSALDETLVSLVTSGLDAESCPALRTYCLRQVRGVDILDPQSGNDLRYALELSRTSSDKRCVTLLLSEANQELLVNYVAPTPTWRVSYRLVYVPDTGDRADSAETGQLHLQGWGIVNNQLDEDLENVELTLVAGQPISFVYDLYTPRFIQRPKVGEEERTLPGPVILDEALPEADYDLLMMSPDLEGFGGSHLLAEPQPTAARKSIQRNLADTAQVQTTGVAKGELFEYRVQAPVTIKRGQSAMVPILNAAIAGRREHVYNGEKMADHPVVTLSAHNCSGLTLERGPVTVLEGDNYVGEAVITFTPAEGEFFVPYAVDLGVKITETPNHYEETAAIRLDRQYVIHDWYAIRATTYTIENRNPEPITLMIEQRILPDYELFDTPEPFARTAEFQRWRLRVAPRSSQSFQVCARTLVSRQEAVGDLSHQILQRYLRERFIDQVLFEQLRGIVGLYETQQDLRRQIDQQTQKRDRLLKEQQQITQKLQNLGREGDEGELRSRFVAKMQTIEDESDRLAAAIATLETQQRQTQAAIQAQLRTMGESSSPSP